MGQVGKLLIMLLVVDLMLFTMATSAGSSTQLLVFGDFLDINVTTTNSTTSANVNTTVNLTNNLIPTLTGTSTSFADIFMLPIFLVINILNLVFSVLFAPMLILNSLALPWEINIMVGGVLMVIYVLGIMNVVRGGDT